MTGSINNDFGKYIYRGILECPLHNHQVPCHYTGTCSTCPIRLLLHVVNYLHDTRSDVYLASALRVLLKDYYKI